MKACLSADRECDLDSLKASRGIRNKGQIGDPPLVQNVPFCDKKYVWILEITSYFCRSIKPIF